ncbi:MAG: DNA polymerase III subunit gamma/tau [Clostridium sp.]|nr:DNA polymerase III subunit gamma/tau [Clostridium sp.]
MSYKALYREWRPQTFEDVVGQDHITTTLRNEIRMNRIGHAYLFSGTRGTGKTTCAKIMAKSLNCLNQIDGEPCNECSMCIKIDKGLSLDVIEQDAATNNKVDDIRELIEEVKYPPHEGKYKVYILDEVHMLSMGAVNAFLKTLEEPPSHVIFILATTDPQKLPVTVLSRCQRFDFKRISYKDIEERLRLIAKHKGIYAEDRSLELISRISDGAMRDALSIMDQAISMGDGKIDYVEVLDMLGLSETENVFRLSDSILRKDVKESINILDQIIGSGKDPHALTKDLILQFRNILVSKIMQNPEDVIDRSSEDIEIIKNQGKLVTSDVITRIIRVLQEAEEQSKFSKQSRIYLEVAIITLTKNELDTSKEAIVGRISRLEDRVSRGSFVEVSEESIPEEKAKKKRKNPNTIGRSAETKDVANDIEKENLKIVKEAVKIEEEDLNDKSTLDLETVNRSWNEIMEALKARRQMIVMASIITGKPVKVDRGVIEIRFGKQYSFNKKRLELKDNKDILENAASSILNEDVRFRFSVEGEVPSREDSNDNMPKNSNSPSDLEDMGISVLDE